MAWTRCIGWGVLLWLLPPHAVAEVPLEPGPWIEQMLAALRPGDTQAAHLSAWTRDETGSERRFEIELLRQSRLGTHTTLVEMRGDGTATPALLKIELSSTTGLTSWSWDLRIQRFVRMSGLAGTENFAGTHFRLEDLGFSALHERRAGAARFTTYEGREIVELESPAYFYYGRVLTRIDPVTALPTVIEMVDRTQARIRELRFAEVEMFGGHPFPTRLEFRDFVTGAETRLEFDRVLVDLKLRGQDFDLEELARRMRSGRDPLRFPR